MKKVVVVLTLILSVVLVVSCASKAKPLAAKDVDDAYNKIYKKYKNDLILDDATTYTVVKDDTLSAIAHAQYGNGLYFPVIMLASSDVVKDPDKINPGMELTIPVLQKNLDDAKAKGKIKSFLGEIAGLQDRRDRADDAKAMRELADKL